jgi:hypothetical protein
MNVLKQIFLCIEFNITIVWSWIEVINKAHEVNVNFSVMCARAIVWLIDFRRGCFEEAQGGVGFGGVVVEACVEACEGFCVVQPQDGSSQ